ncbi:uncharacterized protein [Coffea arabica]|uniref:Uncharacterized protein n=1 Tax=Coffea arabica TaxID=13443 RepID=A0ABM4VPX2_COFAR
MNCYKFLTEIAEKTSGLSALLPTNQVYELPHNPSAKTRRSAGRSHSSAKQVKAIKNKKKKSRGSSYLQISVYIQEEELPGVFLRLFRRRIRCQWICFCYLGLVYQWRWDSFMEVVDFQQIYLYVMVLLFLQVSRSILRLNQELVVLILPFLDEKKSSDRGTKQGTTVQKIYRGLESEPDL